MAVGSFGVFFAGLVSLVALTVLWPVPTIDPLRGPTIAVGRSLAGRLRRSFAALVAAERAQADASRQAAVAALSRAFLATPFRPTGLSTQTRLNVRLVEELAWLDRAISRWQAELRETAIDAAAADVLNACACAPDRGFDRGKLAAALEELRAQLGRSERAALAGDEAGERDAVAAEAFVGP